MARALAHDPEVLLLDEPTASLDPASALAIEGLIQLAAREAGTKVILVTHDLAQARRLAEEVVFLYRGRVEARAPAADFFARPRPRRRGPSFGRESSCDPRRPRNSGPRAAPRLCCALRPPCWASPSGSPGGGAGGGGALHHPAVDHLDPERGPVRRDPAALHRGDGHRGAGGGGGDGPGAEERAQRRRRRPAGARQARPRRPSSPRAGAWRGAT